MAWFVYMIECLDGSLYTGVAVDVVRRYARHAAGKGARYTRSRPPKKLLAVIAYPDQSQALKAEYAIKQLAPADKRLLCLQHPPKPVDAMDGAHATDRGSKIRSPSTLPARTRQARYAHSHGETRMLRIGDPAPSFSLASDSSKTVDSKSLKGRRYVMYFYPKDDTPGCTKEACAFRDNLPAFEKLGVPVFGLSADSEKAHARFVAKYGLNFTLLSDPEHVLLEAYGAWVEKSMYGRKYMGIQRCTFVVGGDGRIEQVWEKVSPETHAAEVRAWLEGKPASAASRPAAKAATKPAPQPEKIAAKKPATPATKATPAKKTPAKAAPSKTPVARKPAAKTKAAKPAAKPGSTAARRKQP